jgi:hypothetical protein
MTDSHYDSSNFVMGYLDIVPAAIFVVDDDVQLLNYNKFAGEAFTLKRDAVLFRRGGDVLHCIHSFESPDGCGHAEACKDCIIRNSVTMALHDGSVTRKHHPMSLVSESGNVDIECLVTTSPILYESFPRALLVIEDVSEIFALRKLIPICAWCRKVRDDSDYWVSVEKYFSERMSIDVTHGMCPDCAAKVREEIDEMESELRKKIQ